MGTKISLTFFVCVALTAVIALISVQSFDHLSDTVKELDKGSITSLRKVIDGISKVGQARVRLREVAGAPPEQSAEIGQKADKDIQAATDAIKEYAALAVSTEEHRVADALSKAWTADIDAFNQNRAEIVRLESGPALKLLDSTAGKIYRTQVAPALEDVVKVEEHSAEVSAKNAYAVAQRSSTISWATLAVAVIVSCAIAFILTRSIVRSVKGVAAGLESIEKNCVTDLTGGLQSLAMGDLTIGVAPKSKPVLVTSQDELGAMATSYNSMLAKVQSAIESYNEARASLTSLVCELSNTSSSVAATSQTLAAASEESGAASSEIAAGSEKLARSATDTASVVQELINHVSTVGNSSQDQLKLVRASGDNLQKASDGISDVAASAQEMAASANEGDKAVSETVEAMTRIQKTVAISAAKVKDLDEKGQQIGEIVGAIEQIAEQTNLLALNAAIEAARAGEHGRGFAVVADEVRKLAEQAGNSTRQISSLIASVKATVDETVQSIEGTTKEALSGAARSEEAGLALKQILANAEQVASQAASVSELTQAATGSMGAMAEAADSNAQVASEMSVGAERVGSSITEVAAVGEESAAGAEELSASIEEVSASANELARMSQDLEAIVARFRIDTNEMGRQQPTKLKVAA